MKYISEERLREKFRSLYWSNGTEEELLKALINECKELNPWQPIEEFEKEANEGWCWIVYKGRVVEAYHDHNGFYKYNKYSENKYLSECISHVLPFKMPEPPK